MTERIEHIAEGVTLYLGDCREILPRLERMDAVVTDPPYGIGEAAGKAKTRTSGFNSGFKNPNQYRRDYGDAAWDDLPIDDVTMSLVREAARWAVIFGGNYYALPATSCWLVWDKLNGDTDFADCELAWTNLPKAVRRIRYLWNGALRANKETRGDHPTQKPLGVMRWVIQQIPAPAATILDPFMGSGTTGVALSASGALLPGSRKSHFILMPHVSGSRKKRDGRGSHLTLDPTNRSKRSCRYEPHLRSQDFQLRHHGTLRRQRMPLGVAWRLG